MHALAHADNPLLSNHILYPFGANLMWNTSDVFPGLLFAPVTAIWGPVLSYNLLILLSPPTTALTAYAAFRRWASRLGAAAGGLLLGFSPFLTAHAAGHLHLVLLALLPLTLLLLDEVLVRQSWRWWLAGGMLGLVAVAQLLTSEELLAFEAAFAVLGVVVLALLHRHRVKEKLPYATRAGLTAASVFLVLGGYPLYVQFRGPRRVTETVHVGNIHGIDLLNTLLPVHQEFRPDWTVDYVHRFNGLWPEMTGYLGLPLLVILIVLLITRWRMPIVLFAAVMGTIALVLSFGPRLQVGGHKYPIPLPFTVLQKMPLMHQLLPGRFSIVVTLFVALGVAVAITEFVRSRRRWVQGLGAVGVVLVALLWIPAALPVTAAPAPVYFTSSAVKRIPQGSVALVLPYVGSIYQQHAMVWQAEAGMRFRMPEGWAIVPGNHAGARSQTRTTFGNLTPATAHVADTVASRIREELTGWHVQTVIVGPYLNGDPRKRQSAVQIVTQVVGRPPVEQGGVQVWYDVQF
jgi:hypothetical protein